jgi:hypothetical protein
LISKTKILNSLSDTGKEKVFETEWTTKLDETFNSLFVKA